MLLQQASSLPGPSGTASPKPNRPGASPNFSRINSPLTHDAKLNSPKLGNNSPVLGNHTPILGNNSPIANSPNLGASPKFGSPKLGGSPKCERAENDEALDKLQGELKEGWTVHTGRDGRLYYCK
ncbi:uncharacterized protein LOC119834007 [Zerene cesonia]|uniref:uncharacterized protein LOC119834007 n=1 Tax=Zerene cesonia TaxID=33412 RepID=UPI0018E54CFE|nr:uncharacterized protein LOC119834007 [Zerene cesonia]